MKSTVPEIKSDKQINRRHERSRHFQAIIVSGWEMQIVKTDKRQLVEEGVLCHVCGYPLIGEWCNRCQDIGVKR